MLLMPVRMGFSTSERERLGVLVNNISVYATQLIHQGGSAVTVLALANLARVIKENEDVLRRLDELAREQTEESPLRLIEDLAVVPTDVARMLTPCSSLPNGFGFPGPLHCPAVPRGERIRDSQRGKAAALAGDPGTIQMGNFMTMFSPSVARSDRWSRISARRHARGILLPV
jgi:hypothetical protein